MNEKEALLLDIANRMVSSKEVYAILAQMKEMQKSLNTCAWGIYAILLFTAAIWGQMYFR